MGSVVSASASVNALTDSSEVTDTYREFVAEQEVLGIDYTEYRNKDSRTGYTKELNSAYNVGLRTGFKMHMSPLDPTADDPTYTDTPDVVPLPLALNTTLDFMPIVEIKSDLNPLGVQSKANTDKNKQNVIQTLKAMNLDLKDISDAVLGNEPIPNVGTAEWGKYGKIYRSSPELQSSYGTEASYRAKLFTDRQETLANQKDITDVSVGYFGTFNESDRVAPKATYHTFLSLLEKTVVGEARKFSLRTKLFKATYTMKGYIHREVVGKIDGNDMGKVGYSKLNVFEDADNPLDAFAGRQLHNDFSTTNTPFFPRDADAGGIPTGSVRYTNMPKHYVSIKVQITNTMYRELILTDLYQETTIEGKGRTKIGNSGYIDSTQGELTWKEAFIAETYIPLTKSSMMKVRMFDRKKLIAETKSYFVQAINVTDLKWYQTTWFAALVTIVGVLVTVFSGGTLVTLEVALESLLIGFIVGQITSIVIQFLVDAGILTADGALVLAGLVIIITHNASSLGIVINTTLADVISMLVEATGKVYAAEQVKETREYQEAVIALKEENSRLDALMGDADAFISSNTSALKRRLQELLRAVDTPVIETRDQFLYRTKNARPQTTPLRLGIRESNPI